MGATIKLAKESSTQCVKHINDVERSSNEFICVGCGNEMIVVKSVARKRDWHFRHKTETDCNGARDKALHDFAVQILLESEKITIKKNLSINYSNPRKEVSVLGKRSDVTALYNERDIHFEVFVTHDLDKEKIALYQKNEILCVKLDLSELYDLPLPPNEIRNKVLNYFNNKTLVYWPSGLSENSSDSDNSILLALFAFVGFIASVFIVKKLRNKSTPRYKKYRY